MYFLIFVNIPLTLYIFNKLLSINLSDVRLLDVFVVVVVAVLNGGDGDGDGGSGVDCYRRRGFISSQQVFLIYLSLLLSFIIVFHNFINKQELL